MSQNEKEIKIEKNGDADVKKEAVAAEKAKQEKKDKEKVEEKKETTGGSTAPRERRVAADSVEPEHAAKAKDAQLKEQAAIEKELRALAGDDAAENKGKIADVAEVLAKDHPTTRELAQALAQVIPVEDGDVEEGTVADEMQRRIVARVEEEQIPAEAFEEAVVEAREELAAEAAPEPSEEREAPTLEPPVLRPQAESEQRDEAVPAILTDSSDKEDVVERIESVRAEPVDIPDAADQLSSLNALIADDSPVHRASEALLAQIDEGILAKQPDEIINTLAQDWVPEDTTSLSQPEQDAVKTGQDILLSALAQVSTDTPGEMNDQQVLDTGTAILDAVLQARGIEPGVTDTDKLVTPDWQDLLPEPARVAQRAAMSPEYVAAGFEAHGLLPQPVEPPPVLGEPQGTPGYSRAIREIGPGGRVFNNQDEAEVHRELSTNEAVREAIFNSPALDSGARQDDLIARQREEFERRIDSFNNEGDLVRHIGIQLRRIWETKYVDTISTRASRVRYQRGGAIVEHEGLTSAEETAYTAELGRINRELEDLEVKFKDAEVDILRGIPVPQLDGLRTERDNFIQQRNQLNAAIAQIRNQDEIAQVKNEIRQNTEAALRKQFEDMYEEVVNATGLEAKKAAAHELVDNLMLAIINFSHEYPSMQELGNPENVREYMYLIMHINPVKWGSVDFLSAHPHYDGNGKRILKGESPMFDENNNLIEGHLLDFIDSRIEDLHNESPDDPINFFQAIDVYFAGMYREIQIGSLLRTRGFWVDPKTGQQMDNLYDEVLNRVWQIGNIRNLYVQIQKGFLDGKKYLEALQQLFANNAITKFGASQNGDRGAMSIFEWFATLPNEFKNKVFRKDLDTQVGDMTTEAFLIHYNIANYDWLKQEFGDMQWFMTRKGVERAIRAMVSGGNDNKSLAAVTEREMLSFIRDAELIYKDHHGHNRTILDLFEEGPDGKLKDGDPENIRAFIDMINPYGPYQKVHKAERFAYKIIDQAAAESSQLFKPTKPEDLDGSMVNGVADWGILGKGSSFGGLVALFMGHPFGAGSRAQMGMQGINVIDKVYNMYWYFKKLQSTYKGGASGSRYTIANLRHAFLDVVTALRSVRTNETVVELFDMKHKALRYERVAKATNNVRDALHNAMNDLIPEADREALLEVMNERTLNEQGVLVEKSDKTKFELLRKAIARRLQFRRNDASQLITQQQNADIWYQNKSHGKSLQFAKYAQSGLLGHTVNLEGLQDDMIGNWITPTRYMIQDDEPLWKLRPDIVNPQLEDKYAPYEWRMVTGLEEKFGQQVIDVTQEMWIHEVKSAATPALKKLKDKGLARKFLDSEGRVIKNDDGTLPDWVKDIMDNKEFNRIARKALVLTELAGALYGATYLRTGYEQMRMSQREQMIHVVFSVSAGVFEDPHDFTKNRSSFLFTKFDEKIFRRISKNEKWRSAWREGRVDGGIGAAEGGIKGLLKAIASIFS